MSNLFSKTGHNSKDTLLTTTRIVGHNKTFAGCSRWFRLENLCNEITLKLRVKFGNLTTSISIVKLRCNTIFTEIFYIYLQFSNFYFFSISPFSIWLCGAIEYNSLVVSWNI